MHAHLFTNKRLSAKTSQGVDVFCKGVLYVCTWEYLSLSPLSPAVRLPITAPMVSATEFLPGFVFAVSNKLNIAVIDRSRIIDGRGLVKGDQGRAEI